MTFYEAALRVLEGEGRPLHFLEITEKSVAQNLLSHVGKMPEQTMLSRLAAMARRTRDRRVMVTAKDTFALTDWALPEDGEALALTGLPEENEEESLPPLRSAERHPEPRSDLVRSAGRSERKRRHDEDEGRQKRHRYPPLSEVAFELLSDSPDGMPADALLEKARERELASKELSAETLLTALLEDNQRRIDAGRRPQFAFSKETRILTLERAGSPSDAPPLELQAAFAEALGIPLEGGRPVIPQRGSYGQAGSEEAAEPLFSAAKAAAKDARKASARQLRARLAEVDIGTLERAAVKMLHGQSFRELKVAKRSKDGPLLTARRREGSVELRYAVRIWRASAPLDRRTVQDLRRDLGHYSAHIGLLLSPQEVRGDARGEAQASGPLVLLWCGDALGEKFLEAKSGVRAVQIELFELDEAFFEEARRDAIENQKKREERQRERQGRPERPERVPAAAASEAPGMDEMEGAPVPPASDAEAEGPDDDDSDDEEGGDDDLEAAKAFVAGGPGAAASEGGGAPGSGTGRRRRRRRRGRRGRGPRPEGSGGGTPPSPPAES